MTTREDIVHEARSWLGTRWQHQATLKGVACDCRGLIVGVPLLLGVAGAIEALDDPDLKGYGREPNADTLLNACRRYMDETTLAQAKPGDVLLFRFNTPRPQHFAILTQRNPDYIVHAYAQMRKVVENRLDPVWMTRFQAVFTYRGLA